MNVRRLFEALLFGEERDARLLDHVPVGTEAGSWTKSVSHEQKLKDARARYGRPFKCAAPDQDREVIIAGKEPRIIGAGRVPSHGMVQDERRAEVRQLARKRI